MGCKGDVAVDASLLVRLSSPARLLNCLLPMLTNLKIRLHFFNMTLCLLRNFNICGYKAVCEFCYFKIYSVRGMPKLIFHRINFLQSCDLEVKMKTFCVEIKTLGRHLT